jgi:hypothetical protein
VVTEPLPEGARQTTVDEAIASGGGIGTAAQTVSSIGLEVERAALQGVLAYVEGRLKALG